MLFQYLKMKNFVKHPIFLAGISSLFILLGVFGLARASTLVQSFPITGGDNLLLTDSAGADKISWGAFNFSYTGDITSANFNVIKVGSPVDSIIYELVEGGSGTDTGTVIASSTIVGSSLPTSYSTDGTSFVFNTPITITSTSTNYYNRFSRSSAGSPTNYYSFDLDTGDTYASSSHYSRAGVGNWDGGYPADVAVDFYLGTSGDIRFIYPLNGLVNVADFAYWEIYPGSSANPGDLFLITYSSSSATTSASIAEGYDLAHICSACTDLGVYSSTTQNFKITKASPLAIGVWYALVRHYDSAGNLIDQTSPVGFSLNQLSPTIFNPFATDLQNASTALDTARTLLNQNCANASTTITQVWNTYGTLEGFACAFQRSGEFLMRLFITPHNFSEGALSTEFSEFKKTFPFSAFFKLTDTVISGTASSSLGVARSINFDIETPGLPGSAGGVVYASSSESFSASNSSTLSSFIGEDTRDDLFEVILMMCIVAMAYITFKTFFHHKKVDK